MKGSQLKLLRHGPAGAEKPGALDATGQARDLSLLIPDFTPDWMSPAKLAALAAIDLTRMPVVPAGARIGAPIAGIVSERFGARYALGLGAAATLVAAAYGISRVGADVTASATVSPRPAG